MNGGGAQPEAQADGPGAGSGAPAALLDSHRTVVLRLHPALGQVPWDAFAGRPVSYRREDRVPAPPDHSCKLRRSGMACVRPHHAAPTGLKPVVFGLGYSKHVARTELALSGRLRPSPAIKLSAGGPRALDLPAARPPAVGWSRIFSRHRCWGCRAPRARTLQRLRGNRRDQRGR